MPLQLLRPLSLAVLLSTGLCQLDACAANYVPIPLWRASGYSRTGIGVTMARVKYPTDATADTGRASNCAETQLALGFDGFVVLKSVVLSISRSDGATTSSTLTTRMLKVVTPDKTALPAGAWGVISEGGKGQIGSEDQTIGQTLKAELKGSGYHWRTV